MASMGWRTSSSRPVICVASCITFALLTTSTALIIVDAATSRIDLPFWKGIAIAAIISNIFALNTIIILTVLVAFISRQWAYRWLLPWISATIVVMASSLSIVTLVLEKTTPPTKSKATQGSKAVSKINVDVELALWILVTVAELIFYILISLHWSSAERRASFMAEKAPRRRTPPMIPEPPPTSLRMIAPPYALPETGAPAPDFDTSEHAKGRRLSSARERSWRDSLQMAFHPRNSQKALLASSRSSISRDSSALSDTRSVATSLDAFDNWDTSNVDLQLREALTPIIPTRGGTLETIPGSRPSSPGKPLEGPFKDQHFFPDSPASSILERPTTALSRHERPPTAQSTYSKRTFIPTTSRPNSPSISESHIHPLFRSDSPTPAPGTTPGTVVTAHEIGGQVILQQPSRSASRMSGRISRNDSQNDSPATNYRAPRDRSLEPRHSFSSIAEVPSTINVGLQPELGEQDEEPESRNGTMTSMSTYTGTLVGTSRSEKSTPNRSRSNSPAVRGRRVTGPPIPEFILVASRERLNSSSKETLRSRETLKAGG